MPIPNDTSATKGAAPKDDDPDIDRGSIFLLISLMAAFQWLGVWGYQPKSETLVRIDELVLENNPTEEREGRSSYAMFFQFGDVAYKVPKTYYDCFRMNELLENIRVGDTVSIEVPYGQSVMYSLTLHHKQYSNRDCIEKASAQNAFTSTIIMLVLGAGAMSYGFYRRKKENIQ